MPWYAGLVQEPWNALLGTSAAILVLVYIVEALQALWTGLADFSTPLKLSLVFTIFLMLYYGIDDVRQALMVRQARIIPRLQALILLVAGFSIVVTGIIQFLGSTSLSNPVAVNSIIAMTISLGLIPPALFSVVQLYRAGELASRFVRRTR